MRGRRHDLVLVGQAVASGPTKGQVVRDAEGRWRSPAGGAEGSVAQTAVKGFIGPVRANEVPPGVEADSVAQVPRGTVIPDIESVDLIAAGTGDPYLDGRYEVTGFQAGGPAVLRLFLKRYVPQERLPA